MKKSKEKIPFACIAAKDEFNAAETRSHLAPLYLSSTYIYESPEEAQAVFKGDKKAFIYSRWTHPNAEIAERKLAQMEGFGLRKEPRALLFSSGMAAVSALFQTTLKPGDSVLVQGNIYGTTVDYLNHFAAQVGLKIHFEDMADLKKLEAILKSDKNIRLLYAETPSNPTVNCYDLSAIAALAKRYKIFTAVDNTFASPLLQRPLELGFDVVLHSSTKYLNGHGNGLSGVLVSIHKKWMDKEIWNTRKLHGSIISPFDAWLLNNGMKTLHLRMPQHCKNAQAVAVFLEGQEDVSKVNYLGLASHSDHALAKKQMRDFGGVLSFELKHGYRAGEKLMKKVKWCQLTASLGTTDTLIQHPASMSHFFVPKKQRERFGITDGLVRLAVGIEDAQYIIDDLRQALT